MKQLYMVMNFTKNMIYLGFSKRELVKVKYLKYFISTITLVSAMYYCSLGAYYPTIYFIGFPLYYLRRSSYNHDDKIHKYKYPFWLDFPIYINLPLLILFLMMVVFVFSKSGSNFLSLFSSII